MATKAQGRRSSKLASKYKRQYMITYQNKLKNVRRHGQPASSVKKPPGMLA